MGMLNITGVWNLCIICEKVEGFMRVAKETTGERCLHEDKQTQ